MFHEAQESARALSGETAHSRVGKRRGLAVGASIRCQMDDEGGRDART